MNSRIKQAIEQPAQQDTPPPCPTCEALARTVMLDQTSHDTQRTWVGLTESEKSAALYNKEGMTLDYEDYAEAIEAKLKEKNT